MFKLTPLTAAILVIVSAQALADDSVSNQNQFGDTNIANVKQTAAPLKHRHPEPVRRRQRRSLRTGQRHQHHRAEPERQLQRRLRRATVRKQQQHHPEPER